MQIRQGNPHLITRSLSPENQETPIQFLSNPVTPEKLFYRRNHFRYPFLSDDNFFLSVFGSVTRPYHFSIRDLFNFPAQTIETVLECAGNKRSKFEPKVAGEQWEDGAISQGIWRGVPLRLILEQTGLSERAKEVVFEAHDKGKHPGYPQPIRYARSLPLAKALHPDTIIAYELNRMPIPGKHGYPLRLIVPNWYGMASVKWLKTIRVIDTKFQGPFQTDDYVYYPKDQKPFPVTAVKVNSTIQKPLNLAILEKGTHEIKGVAWSGSGEITKVQVSLDSGVNWTDSTLTKGSRYSWSSWRHEWKAEQEGEYKIKVRAVDSAGFIQPDKAMWNKKGYGYNQISEINIKIK